MELVDGPTLADRIAQGPVPLEEALPLAIQIADALEAAHEQGIVHRDLKPANVKVRPDATVKVLDFGLAKVLEPTPAGRAHASLSPTITSPATRVGVILGTAAYMAPEQARGRAADRRSDIWAFGCVLYEMLTGRRAFSPQPASRSSPAHPESAPDDVADTLAAVLRAEPDWAALPDEVPTPIRKLLTRCLQKDARKRLPHIGAARLELEEAMAHPQAERQGPTVAPAERRRARVAPTIAAAALAIAALLAVPAVTHLRESPAATLPEMRVEIATPPTSDPSLALSPDGRHLAFVAATDGGQVQLWVRSLGDTAARPLPGTEDARFPFWSPDGRSIGFFSRSMLKRIDLDGGAARTLAPASPPLGASWNADGTIVYGGAAGGVLRRVDASGGEVAVVTALADNADGGHSYPWFLPDQRRFVFFSRGSRPGLYVGSLDSPTAIYLGEADSGAVYAPPGWLLFVRNGGLVAHRFDAAAGTLRDRPVLVSGDFGYPSGFAAPPVSAAANGTIAYRTGAPVQRQLVWFDRFGKRLGDASPPGDFANPAIGRDGRIAVERIVENNEDIWIVEGLRMRRLTIDPGRDRFPVWSADGESILFASDREGLQSIFSQRADGSGPAARLPDLPLGSVVGVPAHASRDGRFLLFVTLTEKGREDIRAVPLDPPAKPFAVVESPFMEIWAQFAPDGAWVAYQSTESGRAEVYIRPFPGPGGQSLVSTAGGIHARWAPNGRELYYMAPDGQLMAVRVGFKGSTPDIGEPIRLFKPAIVGRGVQTLGLSQQYDVSPDGRFLINVAAEESLTPPITLLLNWNPDQKSAD
jgi:Tol biopolymer transport system component